MPKEIERELRLLPGNDRCADCQALGPQWAERFVEQNVYHAEHAAPERLHFRHAAERAAVKFETLV